VGTHHFRLRQEDTDGTVHYSESVSASVTLDEAVAVSTYPNPAVRPTVEVVVKTGQHVRVELFDLMGRRLARLHDGALSANQPERLTLNSERLQLSSGSYFVRVTGETFAETEQITVVR
jgi:hypothetical protein